MDILASIQYIYLYPHVCVYLGGEGCVGIAIQHSIAANYKLSLLIATVCSLSSTEELFVNGTTEAHISTQQSALGQHGPQARGVPVTVWPNRFYGREISIIYTYISTCGHTDQYYSIYIYTHVHVYILGGEGCGGIATQLLHCSLPHFAVYILQRHFCWWHYGGAHIHPAVHTGAARTPSPRSAHYSMAQPLLWKRGVITYEQPIHIAITACHHVIEPQHFQFYIGRLIADINTKITSSVTLVPTQGIFFFSFILFTNIRELKLFCCIVQPQCVFASSLLCSHIHSFWIQG